MEYDPWQKTTFDRRRPLTEDDLQQNTTFNGRRPLTEDDPWRKTTFDRVYSILPEKHVYDSHLDIHSTTDSKLEILSAV